MRQVKNRTLRVLLTAMVGVLWSAGAAAQIVSAKATGGFDEVKDSLVLAVQSRGLKIDHTAHIGNMLERTGRDVGAGNRVYGKAEAIQFCSAVVSRKMMERKAANIAFCPYVIALYTLPGDRNTVHVVYRKNLPEVDVLLAGIVKEAIE